MFQLSDLFKIGFSCMNQKPSLEDKLSNQNLPLEDFLKDDEAVSTTKFMGKNAKKYLNSEKIKKLIKLITEEPKEDDQLHGHKYPYVAYEILKLDCPFISKRFVLNEQEYHEEYPESPDDENGDWGLDFDIENENENNEIENDFKKNKIEFDKIYAKIKEDFGNLKKSVSSEKEEKRSKDDYYKDEYKYDNNEDNNYEEGYEEYEDNQNENPISTKFDDDNQQNHKDKFISDEIKDNNIENGNEKNLENENNNEISNEENQNKDEKNIEKKENKQDKEIKDENKNEQKEEKVDEKNEDNKIIENGDNKDIKEKKPIEEINNENEIGKEKSKEEIKGESNEKINEEKLEENNKIEENEETIKEGNQDETKEKIKEEIKEENNEEIKEQKNDEIKQELNEIKEQKEEIKNTQKNLNENMEDNDKTEQNTIKENEVNTEIKTEEKKNEEKIEIKKEGEKEYLKQEEKYVKEERVEKEDININQENKEQSISSKISENKEDQQNEEKNSKEVKEEKDLEPNNQEEEQNEEMNNIIRDKTEEEKEKNLNNKNIDSENQENIDNIEAGDDMDSKSLSVEGELDDDNQKRTNKKKKVLKNNQNNEYLDLLLNFVMTDKPELNYVLSGYFVNVIISLLTHYPYKILKYLYTQRRDALKKIIFHSNQKAFAILSTKLLNIESYFKPSPEQESMNELINENIPYRNELIREIMNSINLQGIQNEQGLGIDIEAIFALISDLINENTVIAKELIFNDYLCPHLFDILDTDLYSNSEENSETDFNIRYNTYCLFINLTSKLLKVVNNNYSSLIPMDFDFNSLFKKKTELHFNDNMIVSFGKILNNNFLAKKPTLILEKNSTVVYEGLGALNLHILDLVKNMFFFMKGLPKQFDNLLIRNNFCQRSIEFFFKYQWNNIYQNKFVEFFNIYLENEERHNELTQFYFNNFKFQNLLMNFLEEKNNETNNIFQKIKYEFKTGNKINSGIYPHVIDLMYKIQAYSDIEIFTEQEKTQFSIKNLGEFEFSKDEKSNKFMKPLNKSNNLKEIFSKDEKWNSLFKEKVLPVLKKYEGQLCKRLKIVDDEDLDIKSDFGSNNLLLQQMISVLKKNKSRFSIPLSRNDKNSGVNSLNKNKNEKSSIREKLLSKGYRSRHIFDDDDDEDKNEKENNEVNSNENKEEKNENEEENDKMYNDTNYWELKNDLPDKIKKEVDKKTNIIFNYNPITGENDKKSEITEEDELLSIAMGLEQNEKMEKSKKMMYIMPGKLKPINLKTKSNPVQNIFINISNNNKVNNKLEKLRNKKKDRINFFDNALNNENEERENENENEVEYDEVVKKEGKDKNKDDNTNTTDDSNDEIKDEENKMFNEVNYWKTNENYLNEEELKDLLNDL